jgi:hypothetical protein
MPAIINYLLENGAPLHMLEILRRFLEGENDITGDHYNDRQLELLILY